MKRIQRGFLGFATMTLIVGGLALVGLLAYGWHSGQELPIGPAIAIVLVNIYAAVWIVIDKRKARQAPPPTVQAAATSKKKRGRR